MRAQPETGQADQAAEETPAVAVVAVTPAEMQRVQQPLHRRGGSGGGGGPVVYIYIYI